MLFKDLHRLLARGVGGDGMKLWVQHEVNIVQFFVVSAAAYTDKTRQYNYLQLVFYDVTLRSLKKWVLNILEEHECSIFRVKMIKIRTQSHYRGRAMRNMVTLSCRMGR